MTESFDVSPRPRRPTAGQVLPMFVLIMPALLAVVLLVLEVQMLFVARRDAQSAADLAALSGAAHLPADPAQARARAAAVAATSGYTGSDVDLTTPYAGSDTSLEVVITSTIRPILLPLLGMDSIPISARAVAANARVASATFAIYALHDDCRSDEPQLAIDWSGSSNVVNGSIHSSSGMTVSGSANSVGSGASISYACRGLYRETGDNPGILPRAIPEACPGTFPETPCLRAEDPPVAYDWATFDTAPGARCDWSAAGDFDLATDGGWWVGGNKSSKMLRAGKYCARSGTLKLSDSDVRVVDHLGRSGVTFVADKIDISGSGFQLAPYDRGVLAFAGSDEPDAIKLAGSAGTFSGLVYAPRGTVETSGSTSSTLFGGIIADRVRVNGSSLRIDGAIESESSRDPRLIE